MISEMIKFDTAEQFYNWINSGKDLYNVHLEHYVYLDSDDGRLGMAYVDNDMPANIPESNAKQVIIGARAEK